MAHLGSRPTGQESQFASAKTSDAPETLIAPKAKFGKLLRQRRETQRLLGFFRHAYAEQNGLVDLLVGIFANPERTEK